MVSLLSTLQTQDVLNVLCTFSLRPVSIGLLTTCCPRGYLPLLLLFKECFSETFSLKISFSRLKICLIHATNFVRSQPKDAQEVYANVKEGLFVCKRMKLFASYIISERIAPKLGECSNIENKEAARKGMDLAIFIYFLAANC